MDDFYLKRITTNNANEESAPKAATEPDQTLGAEYVRGNVGEGMSVVSSDDVSIGSVVRVWSGEDFGARHSLGQSDYADSSGMETDAGKRPAMLDIAVEINTVLDNLPPVMYIPHQAIHSLDEGKMRLRVPAETIGASAWQQKPHWMR